MEYVKEFIALMDELPLFQTLPPEERHRLAENLTDVRVEPGEVLFREGDPGGYFYVILDGEVEIRKAVGTPEESILSIRRSGEIFGEMSLLNPDRQRIATVRALAPTRLLRMKGEDFNDLVRRYPSIAYQLAIVLSTRMTLAQDDTISSLRAKNQQLQQAYDELKAAQAQLVEKEKLERELQLAREIQRSILPVELPRLRGYDFGAVMAPARSVSGDFYSMFIMEDAGHEQVALVIGDVTDKGVPAAIFMAQAHALLRAAASSIKGGRKPSEDHQNTIPGEILRAVNRFLLEMNDKNMFVTILLGILDRQSGIFEYARAGHELPVVIDPNGEIHFSPMKTGAPLGILDDVPLDENRLVIPAGGLLVLFTDGIPDSLDSHGNRFDYSGMEDVLHAVQGLNAQQVCDRLLGAVMQFQGAENGREAIQYDDITMLVARRAAVQNTAAV